MVRVVRFGDYVFPETVDSWHDNFGNAVPRTTRLPGIDGGYDEFGVGRAPTEIGKIDVGFWLFASDGDEMDAARDAVMAMADWGVQQLVIQPWGASAQRYAWARVNYIRLPEKAADCPDRQLRVTVTYQVADPYWYSDVGDVPIFGAAQYGRGFLYGGGGASIAAAGAETLATLYNFGNAFTFAKVTVIAGDSGCESVTIERLVNDVVRDRVSWTDALGAGDVLVVDGRMAQVTLNGISNYGDAFNFLHPDWMRLMPGGNVVRVALGASDEATIQIRYYARWR